MQGQAMQEPNDYEKGREAFYEGKPFDPEQTLPWREGFMGAETAAFDDYAGYEPSEDYDDGRYDDDPNPYDGNYSEE